MDDSVFFREAEEKDFPVIAAVFDRNNYGLKKEAWIRWKYLENPDGKGRLFIAQDTAGNILGTFGFLPHILTTQGSKTFLVMESVDLFLVPEARGKKISKKLLQYGRDMICEPAIAFPNKFSESIMIRLGWKPFAPLKTWFFPVTIDGGYTQHSFKFMSSAVGMLSRNYTRLFLPDRFPDIRIRMLGEGEMFADSMGSFSCGRSAAFLNWRFRKNPCKDYAAMEFLQSDQSIGYCVMAIEKNSATIFDYCAQKHKRTCLRRIVDFCRERAIPYLFFRGVGLQLWHLGFMKLSSTTDVICRSLDERSFTLMLRDSDW